MSPDLLKGISPSRPSLDREATPDSPRRREMSIDLEGECPNIQQEFIRCSNKSRLTRDSSPRPFESARSPLLLLDGFETNLSFPIAYPETILPSVDGPPLIPSNPSSPSTDSVTSPLDVYLNTQDNHEDLKMNLSIGSLDRPSPPVHPSSVPILKIPLIPSRSGSSWQLLDKSDNDWSLLSFPVSHGRGLDKSNCFKPPSPHLQPLASPRASRKTSYEVFSGLPPLIPDPNLSPEDEVPGSPDSAISDLSLSAAPPPKRVRGGRERVLPDNPEELKKLVMRANDKKVGVAMKSIKLRVRDKGSQGSRAA